MASVPMTAYSAPRVLYHLRQHFKLEEKSEEEINSGPNFPLAVFASTKDVPNYNSKLMNSIWGRYNLYAAHAFQKNNEGLLASGDNFAIPQAKNFSLWDSMRFRY